MYGAITYTEACEIEKDFQELMKVNLAIDKFEKIQRQKMPKFKKK